MMGTNDATRVEERARDACAPTTDLSREAVGAPGRQTLNGTEATARRRRTGDAGDVVQSGDVVQRWFSHCPARGASRVS